MEDIKIKRFFECLIPITICNLRCNYCYIIQRNYRNMKLANMKYSPEHIGKCLNKERLGGICYFSICGAGETLAQPETIEIVHELLKKGHIVNITTNGILTAKFKKFNTFTKEELTRLHFSFSLHYNELLKLKMVDIFFDNVNYVKKLGCSFIVQLNLCDEYMEHIKEIKKICIKKVGAMPQIAATRKESNNLKEVKLHTTLTQNEYEKIGNSFESPLFRYTMKNFNKKRNEFCYAGERSGILDLSTGELRKCYGDPFKQDIFKNPNKKIKFEAVGNNCYSSFCFNSSHFMSLGVIDNDEKETYCSLRNRENANWFNYTTKVALNHKLSETNKTYDKFKKSYINLKEKNKKIVYLLIKNIKKIIKRIIKYEKK